MALDTATIIKQIDDVIAKCAHVSGPEEVARAYSVMLSAIQRLAPPGSIYFRNLKTYEAATAGGIIEMSRKLATLHGTLDALKSDYESGYLQSLVELVHADIFADFIEMAAYLLQQSYKDPAAVIVGSVLEEHLRKLCQKHRIGISKSDGSPKKADTLNADLANADVYSTLDLKSVTHWLDLRNKAAHGHYDEYTRDQVALMLQGVRDFMVRNTA